jgi:uridine phosphorylase
MGSGSAEICLGEVFRAAHYDEHQRRRSEPRLPVLIRLGTCGSVDPQIPLGTPIVSTASIGCEPAGLAWAHSLPAYDAEVGELVRKVRGALLAELPEFHPYRAGMTLYGTASHPTLLAATRSVSGAAGESLRFGATYCAGSGFFEAQGRPSNAPLAFSSLARALRTAGITNIEMESGPILRLAHEWGARALVIAVAVADRERNVFADATAYERGTRDAVRTAIEILGA